MSKEQNQFRILGELIERTMKEIPWIKVLNFFEQDWNQEKGLNPERDLRKLVANSYLQGFVFYGENTEYVKKGFWEDRGFLKEITPEKKIKKNFTKYSSKINPKCLNELEYLQEVETEIKNDFKEEISEGYLTEPDILYLRKAAQDSFLLGYKFFKKNSCMKTKYGEVKRHHNFDCKKLDILINDILIPTTDGDD